jgi:hypothetical protein
VGTAIAPAPDPSPQEPARVQVRAQGARTDAPQDRWRVEVRRQIELPATVRTLRLETGAGDLEVLEGKGPGVEVEAVATARKDKVAEADVSQRFEDHVAVGLDDTTLSLGDAHAAQRGEGAHETVWSVSLRVRVPRALGIHAAAGAGDITIARAAASVTATAGAGDVALNLRQAELAELAIRTGSGTIAVDVAAVAKTVELNAGSGGVTLRLQRTGQETGRLSAGSGEVSLHLPATAGAELELRTGSGALHAPDGLAVDAGGRRARGTLGAGGARYQLTTGSGDVRVQADGAREPKRGRDF